jgi:hypothetical protein
VIEAGATGAAHPELGEVVVAAVRLRDTASPDAIQGILELTRARLADYKVPARLIEELRPRIKAVAAANRDPRANPDPDRFDIRRKDIRHQSFGGGRHLCLGAHLARVETQEAVLAIIQRFPKLSLIDQKFECRPVPS